MIPGHRPKATNKCPECGCTAGGHRASCPLHVAEILQRLERQYFENNKLRARQRELLARIHVLQETVFSLQHQ